MKKKTSGPHEFDHLIAEARRKSEERGHSYREKALKLYPWVCGRCSREFDRSNLHELTVHHRDHNHDNNPEDGSNWELLCLYCHDNEHARYLEQGSSNKATTHMRHTSVSTHKPFADLQILLKKKKNNL